MGQKVMSMKEAISKFVKEGDTIFFAGMQHGEPTAAMHEIVRQRIGHLTLVPALTHLGGLLIAEGLVDKLVHAYTGDLYTKYGYTITKAKKKNKYPVLEEYSHFTLCMGLLAGWMGVPFMVTRSGQGADFPKWNPNIKVIDCPFTGERIGVVKAITPDVGIIHVQKADATGNAQRWGTLGMDKMGIHACNRVIVTAERIVDVDEVRRDPNRTIIPGILTNAVVEEPWGAYPLHLAGEYNSDAFVFMRQIMTEESYEAYMKEYVYGVSNRQEFLEKMKANRGQDYFDKLRIQTPIWSEPIKTGY